MANEALTFIKQYHDDKDVQWSLGVKIRAGWVCEELGCGEGVGGDKKLLEAHHIKPKEQFPELRCDPKNGKCLCLFHHAAAHTGWARLAILARGFLILLARRNPHQKAEIKRMVI